MKKSNKIHLLAFDMVNQCHDIQFVDWNAVTVRSNTTGSMNYEDDSPILVLHCESFNAKVELIEWDFVITKKNLKNCKREENNILSFNDIEGYEDEVVRIACYKQLPFTIDDIVPEKSNWAYEKLKK